MAENAPLRMLKNKVVQQCARLAFGFSGPLFSDQLIEQTQKGKSENRTTPPSFQMVKLHSQKLDNQTQHLKEHLLNDLKSTP